MREIKFRGKRCDNGNWIYGSLIIDSEGLPMIHYYENKTTKQVRVKPKTVGQYTGLKDKSGKEIYEGDIVAIYSAIGKHGIARTGVINYRRGSFYIGVKKYIDRLGVYFPEDRASKQPIEIIGNIHESKNKL